MFGLWKKRKPEPLKPPTYALIDGFETSTDAFYKSIEDELEARKVPGLDFSRLDYREGGPLSARRDYLRMRRERLTFDLCSAPFGTSWFFSYRFCEIPAPFPLLQLLIVVILTAALTMGYVALFGMLWGGAIIGMTVLGFFLLLRNTLTLGFQDFDAWLLTVPVFGGVYEIFRKETFFRTDTRIMYADTIEKVIQAKIKEVTAAEGIEKVEFMEARPDIHPLLARLVQVPSRTGS
ncbi:hypothetical protein [Brevifollis gellanilyticus]|uniref:Uncharacterized protein n=1 Tax=Brevifollis gellanilyticus TaxID=748831 RepID=A0A512MCH7_9BACT|nr:hypothetical protein [Brevifollis gellanilyticus]GEP44426.1 hypothetical protein BGE01nite_37170 [Brevifollis gellanilyticus]